MKIVFLAWRDLANPLAGGSEILVDRLASGLAQRGHDVTLISGGPVGQRDYATVDAGGVLGQYVKAPWLALRHHRDADLVVDVCNGMPFFTPLWRRKPTICLVNHVHTDQWALWFPPVRAAIGRSIERTVMPWLYRRTPFMAVSPSTASALGKIGVPEGNIHVIPNGVDVPAGPLPAKSDEPLFFALGRLVPHKRYDLLIDLWEQVRPQTGGRLVIAGEGPELKRLAAAAGEGVELLGRISEERKQELLARATCLVHPALLEGWGLVIMEAAAHGTPTLGFRAPGVRDAVADGVSGLLADDADQLVEMWVRLATDTPYRRRLSDGARRRGSEFSWAKTVARFEAMAKTVTGTAGPTLQSPRSTTSRLAAANGPALTIVVPAFNESARIEETISAIQERAESLDAEIIVVDDGSDDDTALLARRILTRSEREAVVRLDKHRGKGAAVRAGVARAQGRAIAFMDADLATSLDSLEELCTQLRWSHIAIASRAAPGSVTIGATASRALMGRTFNRLARSVTGLEIRDFQCGLKVFRAPAAKLLFHLAQTDGFAFDVEVLSLADRIGYRTVEVPVTWHAVSGSHIRPVRHSLEMAGDVLRLPARWTSGRVVAAVSAHSRHNAEPRRVVASVDPFLAPFGPVIEWDEGALALLPFRHLSDAQQLSAQLGDRLPHLSMGTATVTSRQLLDADGEILRSALTAG